ncbi:Mitochondrial matrix iron chaperone [Sorochytrium milnesiophthora]
MLAEASDQTELSFHRLADEELDRLLEAFEELGDTSEIAGFDVTLSSGVLTVALGPTHGTYVINKQPPNQQIWLSSPFSGPARFAYDARHRKWINVRQTPASWKQSPSGTLEGLLQSELKDRVGFEVSLV